MQGQERSRVGRAYVASALALAGVLCCSEARAEETYYRYVEHGRVIYTNAAEQVPLPQREASRLDLRHISLNTEIGNELEQRLEQEHAALAESGYCQQLRVATSAGFFGQLWEDFGPLLLCGGVLLLFVLFTPFALRRFGAPVWAKVLMMAIPSLAVAGLLSFTMSHTNRTVTELRQRFRPCTSETFAQLKSDPNPIAKHAELIDQLKREIAKVDAEARF